MAQTHRQTVCDVQARALCDDGVKTRAARAQSMIAKGGVQEEENTGIYKVEVTYCIWQRVSRRFSFREIIYCLNDRLF